MSGVRQKRKNQKQVKSVVETKESKELLAPTQPLADDKFDENSALLVDVVNEFGEEVRAYVPQPSIIHILPVLPFLRRVYALTKEDQSIIENPEILIADWDTFKRECVPHIANVIKQEEEVKKLQLKIDKVIDTAIASSRFITKDGQVGRLKDLITTKEVRLNFEIRLLFQYALIRYAYQAFQVSEMRACYTALSLEDYREHFLKYTEAMEEYLKSLQEQKGLSTEDML